MGCSPSGRSQRNDGLRLMGTKLFFTPDQLSVLNTYFRNAIKEDSIDEKVSRNNAKIEGTIETLVQRLVKDIGTLDSRFSSMFLVSLNEPRRTKQLRFEYILRIDALSTPMVNSDKYYPTMIEENSVTPGFVRLKFQGSGAEYWTEFLNSSGQLRRDLIKSKLTNLLATVIKGNIPVSDNEKMCCTPGQVVDPQVLDKILKQPEHCKLFYGLANTENTLQTSNYRVVLVDDRSGLLLRINLKGYDVGDIEVKLLIAVGISSWPASADYPRRVPLYHCDAILHYTAGQSGIYATAIGPYPGARCEDRTTLWKIRFPAAEVIMNQHYSQESVPAMTEMVLMEILDQLRDRRPLDLSIERKDTLHVISRYIIKTIHWWSLERIGPDPLRNWAPVTLSRHVLLILDELTTALKCQTQRCYFHPRCNVMLQCAKGGVLHHEDSYASDCRLIESYLMALHNNSFHAIPNTPNDTNPQHTMEDELITKWQRVIASLPRGTMSGDNGYSSKQLQYLSLILTEVLNFKNQLLQKHGYSDSFSIFTCPTFSHTNEPLENLIYLLRLTLKQAKDNTYSQTNRKTKRLDFQKKPRNTITYFERSVELLVDDVRRDRGTAYIDLDNDYVMARTLLKWLYFGMVHDKKTLGPILRPYLGNVFNATHENAWHVDSWKKRQEFYDMEMRSLAMFCKLVTVQGISPADGIVKSLSKGFRWAESVVRMIERHGNSLKLLFITSLRILEYKLTFTDNKGPSAYYTWSKARNVANVVRRNKINHTIMNSIDVQLQFTNQGAVGYIELRDTSPLTFVISMSRRCGRQRGPGGLIPALINLKKFRILQEVSQVLPKDERIAMLEMIQRVARETSRRSRRVSCPDELIADSPKETYTPRSESNRSTSPTTLSDDNNRDFIITDQQRRLHREIREIHDTLTRGLRTNDRSSTWDSSSLISWTSSLASKKYRIPIWNDIRGTSPLWDSISTEDTFSKNRSEEMVSREESPKWSTPRQSSPRYDNHSE